MSKYNCSRCPSAVTACWGHNERLSCEKWSGRARLAFKNSERFVHLCPGWLDVWRQVLPCLAHPALRFQACTPHWLPVFSHGNLWERDGNSNSSALCTFVLTLPPSLCIRLWPPLCCKAWDCSNPVQAEEQPHTSPFGSSSSHSFSQFSPVSRVSLDCPHGTYHSSVSE